MYKLYHEDKGMCIRNVILVLLLLANVLWAQDIVFKGGELKGTVNWQGTVSVLGDVIVGNGTELNIAPGTKVMFAQKADQSGSGTDKTRCELVVRGKLTARGLPDNKIVFSSSGTSPRMADWYGIQFLHTRTQNLLEYCIVEYAYNGVTIKNTNNVSILNSEIRYNYNAGIRTEVKAKPEISRCIISENGYAGVICELGSAPVLSENLISGNQMGLVILSLSQPDLGVSGLGGNPGKNQFSNNEEFNIYNHSSKDVLAQNNNWGSQNRDEIAVKIYDKKDNGKYGSIRFEPIFNAPRQTNLNRFIALAQENDAVTRQPNPTQNRQAVATNAQSQTQAAENQPNNRISGVLDSTMEEVLARQSTITATPLLAESSIPSPEINDANKISKAAEARIDYSQIFLEPFLDAGKKRVLYKENLSITTTLKNVIEPGIVRIKVVVNQNGAVEDATILTGMNEIVDSALIATVRNYRYAIGTVNGNPVRFSTNEVFRFK